jgi:ADP-heptose:LPS heptosyltransferase
LECYEAKPMKHFFVRHYCFLVGLFLYEIRSYEIAAKYFLKVLKSRPNFYNVQQKFAECYIRSELKSKGTLLIKGGIGDFLKNLPFLLKNKKLNYIVVSHFKDAFIFFGALKVEVNKFYFYKNLDDLIAIKKKLLKYSELYECPQANYLNSKFFKKTKPLFLNKKKTIGVHVGGSQFSVDDQRSKGILPKNLTPNFLYSLLELLIRNNFNIILFGSQDEIKKLNLLKYKPLKLANKANIIENLAKVEECDIFIGSDSAFKTMSSMLKIPTILLLANTKDGYRDRVFINPYVKDRIMQVIKFDDLSDRSISLMIDKINICLASLIEFKF